MAEDLGVFFSDPLLTVTIVSGALTTKGIFNQSDINLLGGVVSSSQYSVLLKASDFPSPLNQGDPISLDGVNYVVNNFQKIDDGKLVQVELSKV